MLEILAISIAGMLIVFGFLLSLFLLLKAIELFASDKNAEIDQKIDKTEEKEQQKPVLSFNSSSNNKKIKEEEVAAILIALEDMALLDSKKKVIIKQK